MDPLPAESQLGACSHSAKNSNLGTLVGSYANVAAMLDEVADPPGCGGVLPTSGVVVGVDVFGRHIQPLIRFRRYVDACVTTLEPVQ